MRLEIIGRGPWGDVYAKTLKAMDVEYWQYGREWVANIWPDGVPAEKPAGAIIATSGDSHYPIARYLIGRGVPVLIEKPIALNGVDARNLLKMATRQKSIVFCGHTRLYSPAWREFKLNVGRVHSLSLRAGGPAKLGWLWDWGPHLMAMCLDLGFDPEKARFEEADGPLRVTVNGDQHFTDVETDPTPLEVLLTKFMAAIKKGKPNIKDLELGVKVTEALEAMTSDAGNRAAVMAGG